MLFLKQFDLSMVSAIGLSDGIMVKLSESISAELVSLGDFVKALEVLLLLTGQQSPRLL